MVVVIVCVTTMAVAVVAAVALLERAGRTGASGVDAAVPVAEPVFGVGAGGGSASGARDVAVA